LSIGVEEESHARCCHPTPRLQAVRWKVEMSLRSQLNGSRDGYWSFIEGLDGAG